MKKILLIWMLIVPSILWAQPSEWTYSLSFLKESFFYPSKYTFQSPWHPGASLGTEILLSEKKRTDRLLSAELGFYHHDYFQNGVFLLSGYQFRGKPIGNFTFNVQPHLGYLHTWSPTREYTFKNGAYEKKRTGHPSALAGLSAGLDYQVIAKYNSRISITYKVLVEAPFAIPYGVPAGPHTFLSIGIKSKLFAK